MKRAQIIAEIAGGHMGDVERCLVLVNAAKESGADAIKFQFYKADELCERSHADYDLFKSLEFSINEWKIIFAQVRSYNLLIYADVFGFSSFNEADELNVDGFKIHSADLDNISLIESIINTNKLIFLGIGGHKRIEIYRTVKKMRNLSNEIKIVLMPGHQLFPTPINEHSLEEISWFLKAYKDLNVNVGCADHIDGDNPASISFPIAAVGAGAQYIEKHLTIDRKQKWEDYESAIEPDSFNTLTTLIHALGTDFIKFPSWNEGHQIYRNKSLKTYFASTKVEVNKPILKDELSFLRPTLVSNPLPVDFINNKKANIEMDAGTLINGRNINQNVGILINCRTESTRLPQKALKKICGKETISLLIERMKFCKNQGPIILCTTERQEDNVLADIAKRDDIELFRGPNENVALRLLLASYKYNLDHIVRVTGDDLLRDISLIDIAIDSHLKNHADYTYMENMVYSCDSEIISVRALETIVERASIPENTEYLTWYLEDETAFVNNCIRVPEKYNRNYRITLDTIEDFKLFEALYNKLYKDGQPIELETALKFLDENPKVAGINMAIKPKLSSKDIDVSLKI